MATFIRQDLQISSTLESIVGFVDNTAPAATMESGAAHIADDLNNIRSILNEHIDNQGGNWYDALVAPSTLEAGTERGINSLNDGLHAVEKKRVLRCVYGLKTLSIAGAGDTFDILGTGELPGNTTAAVGAVTTLGTVVASHGGTFGTHALDEVSGPTAISPKNLVQIVDAGTRDPILDGGDRIYGLLQGESGLTDGATITDTTTTRVQISFVKLNGAGNDLVAITSGAMDGVSYDYCYTERVRLEDLNEADFLGGANVDVPAGSTVTRQVSYDNQGATPVDLTTNAILDLEGPGLAWRIRDDLEATLFEIIEGSAGGTSQVNIAADVDEFDVDAAVNDFANGATLNSGGTRPIAVGVTDGVIESTAGDLELQATTELLFDDGYRAGSTYANPLPLADSSAEWDALETVFGGEFSIAKMLVDAYQGSSRTRVDATVTAATITAGVDINGPGTAHANTDVDLLPYDVAGIGSLEVFLNGELARLTDDYTAGGTPAEGDLQWTATLRGSGSNPDYLTVIRNGAN